MYLSLAATAAPAVLSTTDYLVFIIYLAVSVAIGLKVGGKQKDLRTFLLAGNQVHWLLVAISIIAALFSGISFLGAPAETYSHNLLYLWLITASLVATPFTALVVMPLFFRLKFYTAYEYLEHRFDLRLRRLSSAIFIARVTFWLALAQYAPSLVVSEMMNIPLWLAVAITGACTILYTMVGGMKAVIATDVMQMGVLLFGVLVILFIAVGKIPGGLSTTFEVAQEGGRLVWTDWSFSLTTRLTILGAFLGGIFISMVQMVTDQVAVQRYLSAKSLKDGQRALWVKLALVLPVSLTFYAIGIVLYAFYQTNPGTTPELASPDRLLPSFVINHIPTPIPGLLVAAILAATMSTVSAGINSLTTATLIDFFYPHSTNTQPPEEEQRRVRIARGWTLFYGVISAALALVVGRLGTLVEATNKIMGIFGGPLLGVFLLGILSRRANSQGTLIGALAGTVSVCLVAFCTPISFIWYAMVGCVSTFVVGEAASTFFSKPNRSQQDFSFRGASKKTGEPRHDQVAP